MNTRMTESWPPRPATRGGEPPTGEPPPSEPNVAEYLPLLSLSHSPLGLGQLIQEVARTDATVLMRGESGVGKNLVARAIHALSPRRDKPFVLVNCAALPSELLESELFGHEKGAFTGAHKRKLGQFEFANGGTICLDEIGELPRGLQAKLLHVLQDLQFSRVGGRELIHVDVRVIATTNRDLEAAIRDGQFREDLYNHQYGRNVALAPDLLALMEAYHWPGNVRELENFVRRLVVLGNADRAREDLVRRVDGAGRRLSSVASAPEPPGPV